MRLSTYLWIIIILTIIALTLGCMLGCTSNPPLEQDQCIQVYKDNDGVMKYRNVDCLSLLKHYQDPKK